MRRLSVLRIRTGGQRRDYRLTIGPGALRRLADDLARGGIPGGRPSRIAVISDRRVTALYGRALLEDLRRAGLAAELLSFRGGERSKTRESKSGLEDRLARIPLASDGLIVALGGGVTGDLAG